MNNNSLKPCPFCGGNGVRKLIKPYRKIKGRGQSYLAIIGCETIGCTVEVSQAGFTREDAWNYAESRWNNRATKGTVRMNDIEKAIEILKRKTTIPNKDESWTDIDKAYDAAISALEAQQTNSWVPVTERLPEAEKEVEVTIERRMKNKTFRFTCRAFYEDGTIWSEDSGYGWGDFDDMEYDEEREDYKISKGWFEAVTYAEEFAVIGDFVVAWRPISEPWKEKAYEDNSER